MNNLGIIKKTPHLIITFVSILLVANSLFSQNKEDLPQKFLRLLNKFDRDSLSLITTDDFILKEVYVDFEWNKSRFLDTYVRHSKAINGTFEIIETLERKKKATTFLVADHSDYMIYLKALPLTWKMKIEINGHMVSALSSDTTIGYHEYLSDYMKKHDAFLAWLKEKYPDESEEQLYDNDKITLRLQEYARKD